MPADKDCRHRHRRMTQIILSVRLVPSCIVERPIAEPAASDRQGRGLYMTALQKGEAHTGHCIGRPPHGTAA